MGKITFVVGAGASCEFGLPSGKQLLQIIANMCVMSDGRGRIEPDLDDAFAKIGGDIDRIHLIRREAAWLSSVALMAPSIDNLIHSHQSRKNIERIGKVMIAKAIRDAESKSFLANEDRSHDDPRHFKLLKGSGLNVEYISDKWIGKLFTFLVEMRDFAGFIEVLGRLNFLCFNYDRCIEQSITSMAMRYYSLDATTAEMVLESINITHIYGHLGTLQPKNWHIRGFGNQTDDLVSQSADLRTFTDKVSESDVVSKIKSAFRESKVAVFLGYGFLEINNRLLFGDGPYDLDRVLGTAVNISAPSIEVMQSALEEAFLFGSDVGELRAVKLGGGRKDKVTLSDLSCAELLFQFLQAKPHFVPQHPPKNQKAGPPQDRLSKLSKPLKPPKASPSHRAAPRASLPTSSSGRHRR